MAREKELAQIAKDCGFAPSGSIPGRMLPKLVKELGSI
jgi:hypothetical protein